MKVQDKVRTDLAKMVTRSKNLAKEERMIGNKEKINILSAEKFSHGYTEIWKFPEARGKGNSH
jgi:hypothetical protein